MGKIMLTNKLTNISHFILLRNSNLSFHFSFLISLAHKKGAGSSKNGRKSTSKRRGIKIFGNHSVNTGSIIVRQGKENILVLKVGAKFHTGVNSRFGNNFTIFATTDGIVKLR